MLKFHYRDQGQLITINENKTNLRLQDSTYDNFTLLPGAATVFEPLPLLLQSLKSLFLTSKWLAALRGRSI